MVNRLLKSVCFWLAVPMVIPQALYLRLTAPRFAPPETDVSGHISSKAVSATEPIHLLAIGDSIIAGVGTEHYHQALVGQVALGLSHRLKQPVCYHSFGKVGIDSDYLLNRQLPEVEQYFSNHTQVSREAIDYIVISTGVNDATSLFTQKRYHANLVKIISQLLQYFPNAKVALAGFPSLADFPLIPNPLGWLFGIRSGWLNNCAAQAAQQFDRAVYLPVELTLSAKDFAEDGYHPNPETYQLFGDAIADVLLNDR